MKYYKLIINVFFVVSGVSLHAQAQVQEDDLWYFESVEARDKEILIYSGLGLSGLSYTATIGEQRSGLSPTLGLGYRVSFSRYKSTWNLLTGAELSPYKAIFKLDNIFTHSDIIDMDGHAMEFRNTAAMCKEIQRAVVLQLPVMLQLQTDGGRMCEWYSAVGVKVGIAVYGTYQTSIATVKNTGYHYETESEFDSQQFMGFGVFENQENQGKLNFNAACLVSLETGVKFPMERMNLYVGIYVDYGLNNIRQASEKPFIEYNIQNPRNFKINSITQSTYTQTDKPQSFTEKITPITLGIKLKTGF